MPKKSTSSRTRTSDNAEQPDEELDVSNVRHASNVTATTRMYASNILSEDIASTD